MPVDVTGIMQSEIMACKNCQELLNHGADAVPGYQYGCKLLSESAFNMIPDETIELNAVFPDCPKLNGTDAEGTRYKTFKRR